MVPALLLMMTVLPLTVAALPLLPCALIACGPTRRWGLRLAPWTPLPSLAVALAPTRWGSTDVTWLLLGTRLGLDETGRAFLLLTSLIWLIAGVYARAWFADRPGQARFTAFFLVTQAGNLGVCVAQDAASFYLFFALMTFGAYGLVAHDASAAARRAGRVYLALALLGEMLVLAGLLLMAHAAGSHLLPEMRSNALGHPVLPAAALLIFLGFGAKTGLPLLHVALPVSYAAAPVPAAAVLAGAMIKAGVLGWMRFLPLGDAAWPDWGGPVMLTGLLMAFFGVAAGLCQRQPGALLGYSSISQMGYFTLAVGAALTAPRLWALLQPALVLFALHHGLAKAALFLGVGVAQRRGAGRWVMAGLALPALALAGAPLSSGALAKTELKAAIAGLPAPWSDVLPGLLSVAAVGTALLMVRLLWRVRRAGAGTSEPAVSLAAPLSWGALVVAVLGVTALHAPDPVWQQALQPGALGNAAWPLGVAALLTVVALAGSLRAPTLPAGDVLVPAETLLHAVRRRGARWSAPSLPTIRWPWQRSFWHRMEASLRIWPRVGLAWLLLLGLLFVGMM